MGVNKLDASPVIIIMIIIIIIVMMIIIIIIIIIIITTVIKLIVWVRAIWFRKSERIATRWNDLLPIGTICYQQERFATRYHFQ